jgi:CRISPR/Cas system-associated exonuclease Cas4 (RecB family)
MENTIATTDERQGFISASYLERLRLCPPSWNLAKLVPREETTALAQAGNNIHAKAAGQDIELKRKDAELTETLVKRGDTIIEEIMGHTELKVTADLRDNLRIWGNQDTEIQWSGLFDRMVIAESNDDTIAIVLDYKTGWKEQTGVEQNLQLRAAAVLAKTHNRKIDRVYVAMIERVKKDDLIVIYGAKEIDQARTQINQILRNAYAGTGELNPSEKACDYCPAKTICPAVRKEHGELIAKAQALTPETLTDEQLGEILTKSAPVEKFIAACETEAKKRIEERGSIPAGDGKAWKLKPGSKTRKIASAQEAYTRLANCIPIERFTACVTVKVGDLEDAYAEATGLKGIECKKAFGTALGDALTEAQNKPTLVKAAA